MLITRVCTSSVVGVRYGKYILPGFSYFSEKSLILFQTNVLHKQDFA